MVKGGPKYHVYDYLTDLGFGVVHDHRLVSPTHKNNVPAMSHVNACLGQGFTASGRKYNDANGDGDDEGGGDAGEPGWKIRLYHDETNDDVLTGDDDFISEATTAGDGTYSFTGLAPDDYIVGEVLKPDWAQSAPGGIVCQNDPFGDNLADGGHAFTITNANIGGLDFGNHHWYIKVVITCDQVDGTLVKSLADMFSNDADVQDTAALGTLGVLDNAGAFGNQVYAAELQTFLCRDLNVGGARFTGLPLGNHAQDETIPFDFTPLKVAGTESQGQHLH